MALRDQPYIPLYVQDFLTDEKLIECSAEATGVYIRLICIMHKSDDYGMVLLKQKDKQSDKPLLNFASKLSRQMPFPEETIISSLNELVSEGVLFVDGDFLCQKRMIQDNKLSLIRSEAGRKGGKFAQAKAKANSEASTENEIENVIPLKEFPFENVLKEPRPHNPNKNHYLAWELVRDFYTASRKYFDKTQIDDAVPIDWYKCANKLLEYNTPTQIRDIWRWASNDKFNSQHCFSLPKFTSNFDRMKIAYQKSGLQ